MSVRSIELGRINQPREMAVHEAAYLAGFIDADGCFSIARVNLADQRRPQFRAVLSISNTNFAALREMQQIMGLGSLNCGYRSEANAKWKNKGQLNVRGPQLESLIPQLAPFLVIKGEQARLIARLIDIKRRWSKDNDNWNEQEALYLKCRALNATGVANQPEIDLIKPVAEAKVCSEAGCGGKHYGHGFCRKHYRWALEAKRVWEPGQEHKCQMCEAVLPAGAPISQKYCNVACRMKWHRRHGCYSKGPRAVTPD